jgi:hypothetical protein
MKKRKASKRKAWSRMQEQGSAKERQKGTRQNIVLIVVLCGIVNTVLALIELVVFWFRGQWSNAFVDVLLDIGLSIMLALMGVIIFKKNRWGWMGAIGLLGFLVLNQSAIATAIWSLNNHGHMWALLLTVWIIVQGMLELYLLFSKNVRNEISKGYAFYSLRKR